MPSAKSHPHAKLIDDLGGPKVIVPYIQEKTGVKVTDQAVRMWKRRGVSFHLRNLVAELAKKKRVILPVGFLDSKVRAA